MSRQQIDNHFARAWEFERQHQYAEALNEYDTALPLLQLYISEAPPADIPQLQELYQQVTTHQYAIQQKVTQFQSAYAPTEKDEQPQPAPQTYLPPPPTGLHPPPPEPPTNKQGQQKLADSTSNFFDRVESSFDKFSSKLNKGIEEFDKKHGISKNIQTEAEKIKQKAKVIDEKEGISKNFAQWQDELDDEMDRFADRAGSFIDKLSKTLFKDEPKK
ncbi:hypothetical protein BLNAU_5584 [Blattamonas nauphoetae]|uniref:MIT domain-containing protein n=1 Tax=Blattamonas nauphoetae TaxID=2049346 RepID=A0ABQ9Y719_9EUKA|nr:hypothetical protein BLNAU_5584 [Blattamonas nauphoetae]